MPTTTTTALAKLAQNIAADLERFASEVLELEQLVAGPEEFPAEPTELDPSGLGPRQQQILGLDDLANEEGLKTADIARAIGYEQPNTYTTLNGLAQKGFIEQVPDRQPQHWRLVARYRPSATSKPYLEVAELVRSGEWTTYGDISIAVRGDKLGARAVGRAAANLPQFPNPHRILQQGGVIPGGWRDSQGRGPEECRRRLEDEGVKFNSDGAATEASRVTWDELESRAGGKAAVPMGVSQVKGA